MFPLDTSWLALMPLGQLPCMWFCSFLLPGISVLPPALPWVSAASVLTPSFDNTDVLNWLVLMQRSLSSQALWDSLGAACDGWLLGRTADPFWSRRACGACWEQPLPCGKAGSNNSISRLRFLLWEMLWPHNCKMSCSLQSYYPGLLPLFQMAQGCSGLCRAALSLHWAAACLLCKCHLPLESLLVFIIFDLFAIGV